MEIDHRLYKQSHRVPIAKGDIITELERLSKIENFPRLIKARFDAHDFSVDDLKLNIMNDNSFINKIGNDAIEFYAEHDPEIKLFIESDFMGSFRIMISNSINIPQKPPYL